jgi:serine/threonine protein phosphatase PrpC
MLELEGSARTTAGRRDNNEDSFCSEPALGLFAVADGMGGYEGGEVASRLVIETLLEFFWRNARDADATWPFALDPDAGLPENMARVGIRMAHEEVTSRRQGRLAAMGSTVAALVIRDGHAIVAHVGDSRVYRLRGGRLRQLTADHSFLAELARAGGALPDRARFGYANVITRAIGCDGGGRPDVLREPLRAGDVFLLCTDGLVEGVADDRIAAILAESAPEEACEALVAEAVARGSRDNVTAIVVRVRR